LEALADELDWGEQHEAPGVYELLNACRARRYLQDQQLVSKVAGGEWALAHGVTLPIASIEAALSAQSGRGTAVELGEAERAFVDDTVERLRRAALIPVPPCDVTTSAAGL
jgi:hypothetical protein